MSIPGGPTLDEVRRLEDDFAAAMTRMHAFGNDLARLRARLATEASHAAPAAPSPTAPAASPAPEPAAPPFVAPAPAGSVTPPPPPGPLRPAMTQPPAPVATPTAPHVPLWQREGVVQRVLAVVGAAITLIGVAFLLAIAISIGIFGPLPRVISGALLAVALVVAADRVRRRPAGTAGAVGLAATGFAAGYLDVLAVTRIYEWVPPAVGLVLAGAIAAGGLLLARAWDSQLLGVVTVLGVSLLGPVVGGDRWILTSAFLLMLVVASWGAQVGRRWHVLELARVTPTSLYLIGVAAFSQDTAGAAVIGLLLVGFVVGTSLAATSLPAMPQQLGLLVPVAAAPVVVAALALDSRAMATLLLAAVTLVLVLLAALAEQPSGMPAHLRHREVSLPTAGLTSLLTTAVLAEDSAWSGPLALLVSVVWALAALAVRDRTATLVALGVAGLCTFGSLALLPFVLVRGWAGEVLPAHLLTSLGVVVVALVLARAVTASDLPGGEVVARVCGGTAVLWAGAGVVLVGALLGQLVDDAGAGFITGQAGATVLWLTIAAALVLRGLRRSDVALPAGLVLVAVSVAKLLFFDLAFLDGLARVLSFILGGLLVLAMGAVYAQAAERARRGRPGPPVDNSGPTLPAPPTV